jgi:HlyD family secretion protein
MNHKRPPILVIILVLAAVLAAGYFGLRSLLTKDDTSLTASGTIETVDVTISPEIGGKVTEVLVDEGNPVKSGQVLFRLDDSLLQAQSAVATANLNSVRAAVTTANAALLAAQSQYDLAVNAAQAEAAATRTSTWTADSPAGYTLPGWYFDQAEAITAAQTEVDAARSARDAAQTSLNDLQNSSNASSFLAVEKRLNDSRAAVMVADAVLTRAKAAKDNTELQLAAQKSYDSAKTELDDAQLDYDDLADRDIALNILSARAELTVAQERYDTARDRLLALQTGDRSPRLAAAQAALNQAQAAADQTTLAVAQAQANLDLLNEQIAKLTVKAPSDGVILTRSIEPGEVIAAGAAAFRLGHLDDLTITVYIPEDRYGEIKLDQTVNVTVDSYPGETFTATVSHIADQAEFTPRNVQTVQGRKSTVFAIKLQVQDPNGRLKPGMPADVTFAK